MKPVDQNRFYDKDAGTRGNCLQATVASILELELEDVPNFQEAPEEIGFWGMFYRYLRGRGFVVLEIQRESLVLEPDCLYLAHGDSPRGVKHSVVYRKGRLVHDPHPSRAGLVGDPDYICLLIPIDPAKVLA